jgi:hypothetical protein
MNIKITKNQSDFILDNINYLSFVIGSYLYGTNNENSDKDYLIIYDNFHKDIDLYYQSKGMALLIGNSMSLFKVNFNGFLGSLVGVTNDGSGEVPKIENGLLKRPNYDAKRIYTIDYKIRNYFINNLINQLQKNIRDSKF